MDRAFNVLISSLSKKVPLVRAVREAMASLGLSGKIIGADAASECVGRYFVDEFWHMPKIEQLSIDDLIKYCLQHQIKAIIPTRDGELLFYAEHKSKLEENGIGCMVSPPDAIKLCRDKAVFADKLDQEDYPTIASFRNLDKMIDRLYSDCDDMTFVVKEQYGSGARSIGLDLSDEDARIFAQQLQYPIYQPYIKGKEYSIDVYIDRHGKSHGAVVRKRELICDGESQITTSVQDQQLENLCSEISEYLGLYGHAVWQVLRDDNGNLHLIECNPRFGGASSLSVAMGLNTFAWFFLEVLGQSLPPFSRSPHEKRQIRYAQDLLLDQ